jgi:hypothetical protein
MQSTPIILGPQKRLIRKGEANPTRADDAHMGIRLVLPNQPKNTFICRLSS